MSPWISRLFSTIRRGASASAGRRAKRAPQRRPQIEVLEDRMVPSTFTVTNPDDSVVPNLQGPAGSLRRAIYAANAAPGLPVHINFALPAANKDIRLRSNLPLITHAVEIDGFTQGGYQPNTAVNGFNAGVTVRLLPYPNGQASSGLNVAAPGCTIQGLQITGFAGSALSLFQGADSCIIRDNILGAAGPGLPGNQSTGLIVASNGNLIGGGLADRNMISGNGFDGVDVSGSYNHVSGNLIGGGKALQDVGNAHAGLFVGGGYNVIGGSFSAELSNSLVFNGFAGLQISGQGAVETWVAGNRIANNHGDGVLVKFNAPATHVGRYNEGSALSWSANVIINNGGYGVNALDSSDTDIRDNWIYGNNTGGISISWTNGTVELYDAGYDGVNSVIHGHLHGDANAVYEVQLFDNENLPKIADQGESLVGTVKLKTASAGIAELLAVFPGQAAQPGHKMTAAAVEHVPGFADKERGTAFSNPVSFQQTSPDAFLVGQFNGSGVWRYSAQHGWQLLSSTSASSVAVGGHGDVVGEFPGQGVWRYEDGTGWQQLASTNASQLAMDLGGDVVAEFPGQGVWRYKEVSGWQQLTSTDASLVSIAGNGVVAAEFAGQGVWRYKDDVGWQQLTTQNAAALGVDGHGDVFGEFAGAGVWRYTDLGGWKQLNGTDATALAVNDYGDLAAEFAGQGEWRYQDGAGWQQLTANNASQVALDTFGDVFGEFPGGGVWRYKPGAGWQQLSTNDAASLA
jgi:hypothetical protein